MRELQKTSTQLQLLLLITLGIYYPAIFSPVLSVDDSGMLHDLLNRNDLSLKEIFFPGGSGSYYRPLLTLSFVMDKLLWGLEESFLHLENVLLHLLNSLLVFFLAARAVTDDPKTPAMAPFAAALLFALHPLNTEAVNWISGRTDLLAGFFLLAAASLLLRRPLTLSYSIASAIFMLCGALAKETAIFFLPAAVLLPFYAVAAESAVPSLSALLLLNRAHLAVFCSAGATYFYIRMIAFSSGDEGLAKVAAHVGGAESAGFSGSAFMVFKAIGFYAKKLFIPFPLNFGIISVSDLYIPLGVAVFLLLLWLFSQRNLPSFFIITAGGVGASALLVPLLKLTWTPLAERYMYVPSAFLLVGLALALGRLDCLQRHRNFAVATFILIILLAGSATIQRNLIWQDNLALFQDTLKKSPDFIPARNELANALYQRGRYEEAAEIYKSFNSADGLVNSQYGLKNRAFALAGEGNFTAARQILKQLENSPGKHEASILLQIVELNKNRVAAGKASISDVYADNVAVLMRLADITGDSFYFYRLGIVHMQMGKKSEALNCFAAVVQKAPSKAYYLKPSEILHKKLSDELSSNK